MENQFKKIWKSQKSKISDDYQNSKRILKKEDESEVGEKHVPVVEIEEDEETNVSVKVGEVEHPSEPGHFIQWIEVLDNDISLGRVYLTHFSKPKTAFTLKEKPENLKVRIFCNLHGTWESK